KKRRKEGKLHLSVQVPTGCWRLLGTNSRRSIPANYRNLLCRQMIGLPQLIKRAISIGRSLLSAALSPARQKQPEIKLLIQPAESGDGTTMEAQLAAGADVNSATESGMTILMSASSNCQLGLVSLLLERGANVKAKRTDG